MPPDGSRSSSLRSLSAATRGTVGGVAHSRRLDSRVSAPESEDELFGLHLAGRLRHVALDPAVVALVDRFALQQVERTQRGLIVVGRVQESACRVRLSCAYDVALSRKSDQRGEPTRLVGLSFRLSESRGYGERGRILDTTSLSGQELVLQASALVVARLAGRRRELGSVPLPGDAPTVYPEVPLVPRRSREHECGASAWPNADGVPVPRRLSLTLPARSRSSPFDRLTSV